MTTKPDNAYAKQLGEMVKKLREEKNITQIELQEKAGLSSGYVSRFESGEFDAPSITHILRIATAFDMTLRDFLEYAELIPRESSFKSCLRGEGVSEAEIDQILTIKNYVLYSNKDNNNPH